MLVRNIMRMRVVYWVNVSESSGAGSSGCHGNRGTERLLYPPSNAQMLSIEAKGPDS